MPDGYTAVENTHLMTVSVDDAHFLVRALDAAASQPWSPEDRERIPRLQARLATVGVL